MTDKNFNEITGFIIDAILSDSYIDKKALEIKINTALSLYGKKIEDQLPNVKIWKYRATFWRRKVKEVTGKETMNNFHAELHKEESEYFKP